MPRAEWDMIGNLELDLPPVAQQRAIADFLDRETAKLDDLISKKERLSAVLLEALESETVSKITRGICPVELIDSGSQWLGAVPRHVRTTTLRHVCSSIETGPFGTQLHSQEYIDNGIPVVNPSNLVDRKIIADPRVTVSIEVAARLFRHRLKRGDIVFGRRGEMGRCALVEESEEGWLCGTGSLRVRPNEEMVEAVSYSSRNSISVTMSAVFFRPACVRRRNGAFHPSIRSDRAVAGVRGQRCADPCRGIRPECYRLRVPV